MARKKKRFNERIRQIIAHRNPKSPISEQYRSIRTNLQFASVDRELQTLVITSSGPSEGKSLTTANVAVVFAQQGKKVLLVDADLRKPTVHYTFQVDNTTGLSNYLIGDASLEATVSQTEVPNLDVATCGPIPPNPSEILSSKRMQQYIQEAKELYDLIIFDTPPVLAVTDPSIIAKECDGALLVVRSKTAEREAAVKSKEQLEQVHANVLGVVLNDREVKESSYYYYYGGSK
ncbi:CpsD/CapB family tyrosine-protein kinase [Virgibacillus sp. MSP4-1]|uniref:CpsD/CapB family tyrosine-protein kinase n=1 Tax=Virgibacillus sp. MSP4-1 TaxID=2700081 RepID=UPI00039EB2DA|nr:CpsD/CapB family tyrosine-protein kinase [Virgibacillus sp. MSP4-1]QHS23486.1 CpsD/CapB family tyrosine-protein kinase [Virgibacillus sp. MSP4-1]